MLLFNTSGIIAWGGFFIIALFVFAETGLLLGLVVPGGETLLFTAGLLVSTDSLHGSIETLLVILILAGVAGDISGFFIGRKFQKRLYRKEDTWYFKKKYLKAAEDFINKHKKSAIIFGKFLPIIRPFTPVISGTTHLPFSIFITLSIIACLIYMCAFTLTGYYLGSSFPQVKDYLGWILPISIILALIPVVKQIRKYK
ncbi:DedA family protein [Pedobacter sp. SYSU D00535]|uniref:DedA family protein n=1 Tax=Pedobacter sp. SYSU D00535 TaxID=2810308 RepID=UPI001A97411D|nr:DedA family protein [Pedobacter sp. SYSU D00535]